jgi:hypothetical protein
MELLFFEAPKFLLEFVFILFGRFAIELLNECSLSFVKLLGSLFGLPVKFGHIQLHHFSFLLDLLALLFFLLEGFESNQFGYGREFGIC